MSYVKVVDETCMLCGYSKLRIEWTGIYCNKCKLSCNQQKYRDNFSCGQYNFVCLNCNNIVNTIKKNLSIES